MPTRREPQTRDELIAFLAEEIRNLKRRVAGLAGVGRTGDHGSLAGLGDDDHPQYVLETLIDAKGDLLVGVADNQAGILPVGADGAVATADSAAAGGISWQAPAATGHIIQESGVDLAAEPRLNFKAGLVAADNPGVATDVDLALDIRDEGASQGAVTAIDFAGAGVTAAVAGGVATITIAGGGGGSGDDILGLLAWMGGN